MLKEQRSSFYFELPVPNPTSRKAVRIVINKYLSFIWVIWKAIFEAQFKNRRRRLTSLQVKRRSVKLTEIWSFSLSSLAFWFHKLCLYGRIGPFDHLWAIVLIESERSLKESLTSWCRTGLALSSNVAPYSCQVISLQISSDNFIDLMLWSDAQWVCYAGLNWPV